MASNKPQSTLDDLRELLIDFGLPALIIIICAVLLCTGKDSEVKTVFAMAAGWLFKSGITRTVIHKEVKGGTSVQGNQDHRADPAE
ncbi:MAG: hypothetical protein M0R06_06505 [Sphaerochaeta sp.]|jgi:hypothetical protein|nr:hypothetical protein [Sphaerochaeta sp.]